MFIFDHTRFFTRTRLPEQCAFRVPGLDHIRGIVCLCIALGHLGLDSVHPLVPHLRPGTECFMVLTGFFLANMLRPTGTPVGIRRLVRRRIARLVIPYAVALTICTPVLPLAAAFGRAIGYPNAVPPPSGGELLLNYVAALAAVSDVVGRPEPVPSFWSMTALLQATALAAGGFWLLRTAVSRFRPNPDRQTYALMTAAAGLAFLAGWQWAGVRTPNWWLGGCLSFLCAGWLTAATSGKSYGGLVAVALVGSLMLSAATGPLVDTSLPFRPVYAALTVAVLVTLTHSGWQPGRKWGWLSAVGRRSYCVYLTHLTVGGLIVHPSRHVFGPIALWPAFALAVAASGVAAWAFFRLVEEPTRPAPTPPAPPSAPDTVRLTQATTKLPMLTLPVVADAS